MYRRRDPRIDLYLGRSHREENPSIETDGRITIGCDDNGGTREQTRRRRFGIEKYERNAIYFKPFYSHRRVTTILMKRRAAETFRKMPVLIKSDGGPHKAGAYAGCASTPSSDGTQLNISISDVIPTPLLQGDLQSSHHNMRGIQKTRL